MDINLNNKQTKFWIHFDTAAELSKFAKVYKYGIGNKCCGNTGAFLPGIKSKHELDEIQDCFLKQISHPSLIYKTAN